MPVSASLTADKVAVVTGAGAGIGRSSALLLAKNGAAVVVNDIDEATAHATTDEITAAGGRAIATPGDVSNAAEVDDMVQTAVRAFDRIDILVNNAGHYLHPPAHFIDSTEEQWDELFAVNTKTVLLCSKAVLPVMIDGGEGGSIISITTVEALRGYPNRVVYSATKAAVTGFTRSLAPLVAPHRIRVNEIAPDKTWTKQTSAGYERLSAHHADLIPWWVPIGRLGTPEDIASVVLFLASDMSVFVTGATINADGGTLAAAGWYRNADGTYVNTPANQTLAGHPAGFRQPQPGNARGG